MEGSATTLGRKQARLIKAFTHPLRITILARLDEQALSPKELAAQLRAPLSVVSYHVKELARLGFIELVRTEQRRGAIQHWYKSKERQRLGERLRAEDIHISRESFELDERGWGELSELLARTLERIDVLRGEAQERLTRDQEEALHATVSLMLFEGPAQAPATGKAPVAVGR